jgi:hypothetical protein
MWGRKLLINTMLKAKQFERGIPELDPIVTVNSFQVVGMLIIQPQSQAPKVLKHFILSFQEENQRVTRIVINDDKTMIVGWDPIFREVRGKSIGGDHTNWPCQEGYVSASELRTQVRTGKNNPKLQMND